MDADMYKYELHSHTSEVSRCSKITADKLVDFYYKQGFTGLFITDHFFNGNCIVPKDISWKERVERFCIGYENALKKGNEIGLDVFFGWEFSLMGTDFLTYCLDKEWLLEHEGCDLMRISDYCDLVHSDGGFVAQAHPFREANYIELIRLLPRKADAVEVINANRTDFENKMADMYSDNYSLLKISGSDNHFGMQKRLASLDLKSRAEDANEVINAIKNKEHEIHLYELKEGFSQGEYEMIL